MITPTPTELMLDSGMLKFGVGTSLEDIGTDGINIEDHFVVTEYAKVESGSQVFNLPTEYVDAKVGVPREYYRTDDVESQIQINGNVFAESIEALAFFYRRDTTLNYATTGNNGSQTNNIMYFGTRRPSNDTVCLVIDGVDVGGIRWFIGCGFMQNKADAQSFTWDATHTKTQIMYQGLTNPNQSIKTRNIGFMAKIQ